MVTQDRRDADGKWIDEVVGVFKDPIITYSAAWAGDIPGWLKNAITTERLMANMKALRGEPMMASDAEVAAYLMTASLDSPLDHDFVNIYLFCAMKTVKTWRKTEIPEDIAPDKLSPDEERELRDLKFWLYDTRLKHRRGELREERIAVRAAAKEEAARAPVLQPGFDL